MLGLQSFVTSDRADIGVLFPPDDKRYFVRQGRGVFTPRMIRSANEDLNSSPQEQSIAETDVLVRLPSLRESKWKVRLLQRWVGHVEEVRSDGFVALLNDETNTKNPPELIEFDVAEVAPSDLPLLSKGASFYWSIGYRDSSGGQRERISMLRFARHPRLSKANVQRVYEQAERLAALLESD